MTVAVEFFELLPEELRKHAVIAGGAAVDFARADDVDIWILSTEDLTDNADTPAVRDMIRSHLDALARIDFGPLNFFEERETPGDAEDSEYGPNVDGYVIFEGIYRDKKFQILVTRFDSARKLLANFDLSVHRMAIEPDGHTITDPEWTKPSEPICITNFQSPEHTFARLRKLYKRYRGGVNGGSLVELARATGDERAGLRNEAVTS